MKSLHHFCIFRRWLAASVAVLLALVCMPIFAAPVDVYDPGESPEYSLKNYHDLALIGGTNDDHALATNVLKLLDQNHCHPIDPTN